MTDKLTLEEAYRLRRKAGKFKYYLTKDIGGKTYFGECCVKATEEPQGWLHYELKDGTVGTRKPGAWIKM